MPRSSSSWEGAEAMWISVAGWAEAAERKFGNAVVITSDRIAKPIEVRNYPLKLKKDKFLIERKFFSFLPSFFKIFFNDLLTWKQSLNWKILDNLENKNDVAFVWEKHDLFYSPGYKLAKKLNVPLISYVHAPVVWEARKWGVKRYFWGNILESHEASSLKKADFVAVVSPQVKIKLIEMGVEEQHIIISPMAVDPNLFKIRDFSVIIRDKKLLDLEDKFVIGWTGSFRSFHGINHVIRAFSEIYKKYPNCVLLLVGDGLDRKNSIELVEKLQITDKVIFTGKKDFSEIPKYVSLFNIAVVSALSGEGFHYSPLKLREYLAAGAAVLAPNAGEIPSIFQNEKHLKLFEAGQVKSLKEGMEFYLSDDSRRGAIAEAGKNFVLETGTWDYELEKCVNFIFG